MQCDALLINGNVIVNESMLTGESIPITKTGIGLSSESGEEILCMKKQKKNILFAGTNIIQTRYYANEPVKAVVLRTGFRTSKGELIRAILYPKPIEFRFNTDLYKYIMALVIIALAGMIFTIILKVIRRERFSVIYTHFKLKFLIPVHLGLLMMCFTIYMFSNYLFDLDISDIIMRKRIKVLIKDYVYVGVC